MLRARHAPGQRETAGPLPAIGSKVAADSALGAAVESAEIVASAATAASAEIVVAAGGELSIDARSACSA